MALSQIIDSHIHLWPSTATQSRNHGWMTPGHHLAKQHGIEEFLKAANPKPQGFIYVETHRYLPSPAPEIDASLDLDDKRKMMSIWAKEPLKEVKFLRRIVEGLPEAGDGFTPGDGELMKACVVWAPFHLPHPLFQIYLSIAQDVAGPSLWNRVVGFRYLLQGKAEGEVKTLVESEAWLENMMFLRSGREGHGWTFDVGVDTHRDGAERLDEVISMILQVRRREAGELKSQGNVRFILNHLNKPALSNPPSIQLLSRHQTALSLLSADQNVYIKLSGGFNEMPNNQPAPDNAVSMVSLLRPWTSIAFAIFPQRVLFGSDWPVCNIGGPRGQVRNWTFWMEIVQQLVQDFEEEQKERVWWRAAVEAYGLEPLE